MIRIRCYTFTLSIPIILAATGIFISLMNSESIRIEFNASTLLFAAGLILQIFFTVIFSCPRCGKSPYAVGPHLGGFALAGKPIPDRQCSKCGHNFVVKSTSEVLEN